MKMAKEFTIGANKEKWGTLVPETDIDREVMLRIFIEKLGNIPELEGYKISLDMDGLQDDGSLGICVARIDDDQANCCGGFVSMLAFGGEYHVDIDFSPKAKHVLPESMRGEVGYELGYDIYGEDAGMMRQYERGKKMIEREYPENE